MNTKWIAIVAVVFGVIGTLLGIASLSRQGDSAAFDEVTINMTGTEVARETFPVVGVAADHPEGTDAFQVVTEVTGDRTGQYFRECTPVISDLITCDGAFQLNDGDVEIESTSNGNNDATTSAVFAVTGGTDAYAGATGTAVVDWINNTYTLNMWVPNNS